MYIRKNICFLRIYVWHSCYDISACKKMIQDDSYHSYDSDEYTSDYEYTAASEGLLKSCDDEMSNTDNNSNQTKDDSEKETTNCHNIEGNDEMTNPETQNIDDTKTEGNMGMGSNQLEGHAETASTKITAIGIQNENENCEGKFWCFWYLMYTHYLSRFGDTVIGINITHVCCIFQTGY